MENLFAANKFLNAGNTDACLLLVQPCSHKGNDESIRWQAYRLMSMAYLLKGYQDSARMATENMLEINPTYKPNLRKDPAEFVSLTKRIVVIPKFTLGITFSLGSNITFPEITKGYIVSDYYKTYTTKSSFQLGTDIGYYFTPKFELDLSFMVVSKQFVIDYEVNDLKINVAQRFYYLDLPLTAKYLFRYDKPFRILVQGGGFGGFLMYAENDFQFDQYASGRDFKLLKLNSTDRMKSFNFGVVGGLGAYYKIGKGDISLLANYFHSFANSNRGAKRYNYEELLYTYYYVDDDFKLHNLAISFGYSRFLNYQVYRSKKTKNAK